MSNIPLKGGDDNEDVETADKANDNPSNMSERWNNLSKGWKVGIPLIIAGAILIVVGVIVGLTVGDSKQGPLSTWLSKGMMWQCWVFDFESSKWY